ncbi:hypothetical protein MNV49_000729 [Pseudohyphozyma bogoriensis]|nr:hypothetical protein MNV49_000729 [Pseudohyphozyma bogoriensis]
MEQQRQKISFKVTDTTSYPCETRKIPQPDPFDFATLERTVAERFGLSTPFSLSYTDEDGDQITLVGAITFRIICDGQTELIWLCTTRALPPSPRAPQSSQVEFAEFTSTLSGTLVRLQVQNRSLIPRSYAPSIASTLPAATATPALAPSRAPAALKPEPHSERLDDVEGSMPDEIRGRTPEGFAVGGEDEGKAEELMSWSQIEFEEIGSESSSSSSASESDDEEEKLNEEAIEDVTEDRTVDTLSLAALELDEVANATVALPSPSPSVTPNEPTLVDDPVDEPLADFTPTDDPADEPLPTSEPEERAPPIQATLSSFLSSFPIRADRIKADVAAVFEDPSHANLYSLFTTPPASIEEVPSLVRGVTTEIGTIVGDIFQGLRREADGLREEFAAFKVEMDKERAEFEEKLKESFAQGQRDAERFMRTQTGAEGDAAAAAAASQENEQRKKKEADEDELEAKMENGLADAASAKQEWDSRELDAEYSREAEKLKVKAARKAYVAERAARKAAREEKRAAKEARKEKRKAESAAKTTAVAAVDEAPAQTTDTLAAQTSPFDDALDVAAPESSQMESQSGRVPKVREHPSPELGHRATLRGKGRAPRSEDAFSGIIDPVPSDDFFHRKVSASKPRDSLFPAPLSFPPAHFTPPTTFGTGQSFRSWAADTAAHPPKPEPTYRVPGAFTFETTPNPAPVPSTSRVPHGSEWSEVTPSQLFAAVKELGFDPDADIGVRIAVERSWEEHRGATIEKMIESVAEKVLP